MPTWISQATIHGPVPNIEYNGLQVGVVTAVRCWSKAITFPGNTWHSLLRAG